MLIETTAEPKSETNTAAERVAIEPPVSLLLVDDEPRNLDVLESILVNPDYRLVRAQSAEEALLALIKDDFAVIVLDIRMPNTNGLELAQMIKDRKKTQHIPIIFMTAYFQEDEHVMTGYGAGAVDYLGKPCNPAILRSKVAVFVDLFRKTRALQAEIEERKRLEARVAEISESEQRRIGQELHDDLGQRLTGLTLMLKTLGARLAKRGAPEANEVDGLHQMAQQAVTTTRNLAHGLCSPLVRSEGLNEALDVLAKDTERQTHICCRFVPNGSVSMEPAIASQLFRIAQEAVTNAVKHGRPSEITIQLNSQNGRPSLKVTDDGVGIPEESSRARGLGLNTMGYRARLIGAQLSVQRNSNGQPGTTLLCAFDSLFAASSTTPAAGISPSA
jgi:signal transduction histidine kinase